MPFYSNSPHKPGSAEDMTFRIVEDSQERNAANAGEAMEMVAHGLAYVLRFVFRLPVFAFRGLRRSGVVVRWTVTFMLIASVLALMLSFAMHDEIMRAQIRLVPVGAVIGLVLGLIRRATMQSRT